MLTHPRFFELPSFTKVPSKPREGTVHFTVFPQTLKTCDELLQQEESNRHALSVKAYYLIALNTQESILQAKEVRV